MNSSKMQLNKLKSGWIFLSLLFMSFMPAEPINYKTEFGSDYTRALLWIKSNEPAFDLCSRNFNVPAATLQAIVFPELIRYNSVFDAIEINTLKFLYVSEGKDYADFSIGHFQMKPSFAEMIEEDANNLLPESFLRLSGLSRYKGITDNETTRRERVVRLTSTLQQLIYLCAFYKICELKFSDGQFKSPDEKIRFLATCYNAGYRRNYDELVALQLKKHFHTGKLFAGTKYNYADISAYYLNTQK